MDNVPGLEIINERPNPSSLIPQTYGDESTGGGGAITGFNRLDLWSDYIAQKRKWVLSAYLGWDLNERINTLAGRTSQLEEDAESGTIPGLINDLEARVDSNERSWQDVMDTIAALENAMMDIGDGEWTDSVSPITIQTMQLIAGDESLQFRFVNNKTTPVTVVPEITYNHATKRLTILQSILQHMTLGIEDLKQKYVPSDYKFFDVGYFESNPLVDEKLYYLEVVSVKGSSIGNFALTEMIHKMDEGDGNYYFLVGILNQVRNGSRSFAPLYGYTEILPGRINTNRISSNDGKTYFDLATGEIKGNITIGNTGTLDDGTTFYSKLEVLRDQISSTVSQEDFNALDQQVGINTTNISQDAFKIQQLVTQVNNTVSEVTDIIEGEITYTEWSQDKYDWHQPPALPTDIYYRQKRGIYGTWGAAIKAIGEDGTSISFKSSVNTYQDLLLIPSAENTIGDGRITNDTGTLWIWDGSNWSSAGRIKGPDGRSGRLYRAYADIQYESGMTASQIGFSRNPAGKIYLGLEITFNESASSDPAKYDWMKIQGAPGRSVHKIQKQYFVHDVKNVPPPAESSVWSFNYPAFNPDKFLWIRDRITYRTPGEADVIETTDAVYNADWEAINDIRNKADSALSAVSGVNDIINTLVNDLEDAIGDGVVDAAEAASLSTYVNTIRTDRAGVKAEYDELNLNKYLLLNPDAPAVSSNYSPVKNALISKWGTYDTRTNNLLGVISAAIANYDPVNSKTLIDTSYNLYRTSFAELKQAIQKARDYIQNIIEGKGDQNLQEAKQILQTNIDQKASKISLEAIETLVDEWGIETEANQAELNIQADKISSLVTQGDTISAIIQDATSINMLAEMINNTAETLNFLATKTEFDALGNLIDGNESRIALNEDSISSFVTRVNQVENDVNNNVIVTQWGPTTNGPWHFPAIAGDLYYRQKTLTSSVWGAPIKAYGENGQSTFKSTAFIRSNTPPSEPKGGSYASPNPTTPGWSDGIPAGEERLYASTRIFTSDGKSPQQPGWTNPEIMADTVDFDVEFSAVKSPNPPVNHPNTNPQWTNTAASNSIWMATSSMKNGVWSPWNISKILGEDGTDGQSSFKSTIFTRKDTTPSAPSGGSYLSPIPSPLAGWSDGIPDGEEVLWASTRIFTADGKSPQQSVWSTPAVMSDSSDFDVEFSSLKSPSMPTGHPNTNTQWSNTADESTIWMATSTKSKGVWSPWTKSKIKGEDGSDGTSVNIKGGVNVVSELPRTGNTIGDGYIVQANGHLYVWTGSLPWLDAGPIVGPKGENAYLHRRYSTSSTGTFMQVSPVGMTHLGIQVTNSPTASNIKSDYDWIEIKGEKGDPGAPGYTPVKGTDYFDGEPGQDGKSEYMWIRYSQNSNGSGMITSPANAKYIGIAVTSVNSAPISYTSYNWTLVKGTDGIPGEPGPNGETSYLHIKYSNDGFTFTPAVGGGKIGEEVGAYIGTYVDFIEADSEIFSRYTWNKVKGEDGYTPIKGVDYFDGEPGQNGVSQHLWVRYSQNANGNPMTVDPFNAKYVGIATTDINKVPTYDKFKWTLFKGTDGIPGEPGPNGEKSYLHIKYSNNGGVSFTANSGETVGEWIGMYVDFVKADSMILTDYTWNKIKGDKGQTPAKFTKQFYVSDSKTSTIGSTWGEEYPVINREKFLWTRDKIDYVNPVEVGYTDPVYNPEWELIDDILTTVEEAGVLIEANRVNISAHETTINGLGQTVEQHGSQIDVNTQGINASVKKGDNVSELNMDSESITAIADTINLNGLVHIKEFVSREGQDTITINQDNDNEMKFRHDNGVVAARIGIVDGNPAMIWYDRSGEEVWRAGETGIVYVNVVGATWTTSKYHQLSFPLTSTGTYLNTQDTQAIQNMMRSVIAGTLPILSENKTLHYYSPGTEGIEDKKGYYPSSNYNQERFTQWVARPGNFMMELNDNPNKETYVLVMYKFGVEMDRDTFEITGSTITTKNVKVEVDI